MNSVSRVKAICKERKIPISHLERDLGYANGYIGQLRKGTFPDDRLVEIANYLNVSASYLSGAEEQKEKSPAPEGTELNKDNYRVFLESLSFSDLAALNAEIAQLMVEKANSEQ